MSDHQKGWIGVDFDGTLASKFDGCNYDLGETGPPIPKMRDRVLKWLSEGKEVRIVTARVAGDDPFKRDVNIFAIQAWCRVHLGTFLPVTCEKDYGMIELWDDRAIQVILNTGERADGLD